MRKVKQLLLVTSSMGKKAAKSETRWLLTWKWT
jgi:hypothetical protein